MLPRKKYSAVTDFTMSSCCIRVLCDHWMIRRRIAERGESLHADMEGKCEYSDSRRGPKRSFHFGVKRPVLRNFYEGLFWNDPRKA